MGQFSLSNYVSADTIAKLSEIAENPAEQFMKGQSTSPFAKIGNAAKGMASNYANMVTNNAINAAQNITNQAIDVVNSISGTGIAFANNVVTSAGNLMAVGDIVSNTDYTEVITALTLSTKNYLKDDLTEFKDQECSYLTQLAMTLPTYFAKRTAYWTKIYTAEMMKDIASEFISDKSTKLEKAQEKADNAEREKKINDFKQKVSDITKKVTDITAAATSYISTVTQYITSGPEWLEKNLQTTISRTIDPFKEQIHKEISDQYYNLLDFIDGKAKDVGSNAGAKVAVAAKKVTKKALSIADKLKATAISFAKSALQLVKQKAMALIGM